MDADYTEVAFYPETLDNTESIRFTDRDKNGYPIRTPTSSDIESDDADTTKLLPRRKNEDLFSEDDIEEPKSKLICGYTKRGAKILASFSFLSILEVFGFSVFTPFFPVVAKEMNMTQTQIGATFAGYSVGGIAGSMITGTLLVKFGARFLIVSGVFVFAVATMFFGILKMFPANYFYALCMLCRLVMGFGANLSFTAMFAVVFHEFTDRSLTVIGVGESLCSVGGMIGPLIGAGLYALGGYPLPFFFVGGLLIIEMVLAFFAIPAGSVQNQKVTISPARLLLNIYGIFGSLFVVLAFTLLSFVSSNLSVHLIGTYNISPVMIGVYMVCGSICYGISTTLFGYIADAKKCGPHLMAIGGVTWAISLIFYGPAEFVNDWFGWDNPPLWLSFVMYGVIGVSTGAVIMPTFGEMLEAASRMKLRVDKLAEYGLVSGLWNTMFAVGEIVGPSIGGFVVEKYNFPNSCVIFGMTIGVVGILKIFHLIVISRKGEKERTAEMKDEILRKDEL